MLTGCEGPYHTGSETMWPTTVDETVFRDSKRLYSSYELPFLPLPSLSTLFSLFAWLFSLNLDNSVAIS